MENLVLYLWTSETRETRSWSAGGVSFLVYCNLCTRDPIFNLKMFSSLRISNRVKYGVAFSLLCAKKMQRRQFLWPITPLIRACSEVENSHPHLSCN